MADNIQKLSSFLASSSGDGALLTIEAQGGETFEVEATFEQLEMLVDTLDDLLAENDDATEVKEDATA